jgi:hypothetical protein
VSVCDKESVCITERERERVKVRKEINKKNESFESVSDHKKAGPAAIAKW